MFVHAEDLFVEAMPLTWPHTQHSGGRGLHPTKSLRRSLDHLIGTASSVGGSSRPSALTVFRLITSWYLEACSTGKSAGLLPSEFCRCSSQHAASDPQILRIFRVRRPPNRCQDLLVREDLSGVTSEKGQKLKLLRRAKRGVPCRVEAVCRSWTTTVSALCGQIHQFTEVCFSQNANALRSNKNRVSAGFG